MKLLSFSIAGFNIAGFSVAGFNVARTIALICLAGAPAITSAEPPRYRITDLGTQGLVSTGWSVNEAGQVVGETSTEYGEGRHAYLYADGVMQDLGTLGRINSTANDINDFGLVAGTSDTSDSQRAFLYSDGVMLDLGERSGDFRISTGEAVNDFREVTGYVITEHGPRAYIYRNSTITTVELPPEAGGPEGCADYGSVAYGINNSAQLTGSLYRLIPGNLCLNEAFVYSDDTGVTVLIGDLLPDFGTVGYDINDSGEVVIHALPLEVSGIAGAFLYSHGRMARIGGRGFIPWGINNAGWVVGQTGGSGFGAFLYADGQVYDLSNLVVDMSGWDRLESGREISDSGYITGIGETDSGAHAFLLTPVALEVRIDIRPGHGKNSINLRSKGNVAVAILSTGDFDATQVDWVTVRFGPGEATERHERIHLKDLQGDGDMDAVLHFKLRETGIRCHDKTVRLTGETFDGREFTGADRIKVVKCRR